MFDRYSVLYNNIASLVRQVLSCIISGPVPVISGITFAVVHAPVLKVSQLLVIWSTQSFLTVLNHFLKIKQQPKENMVL